MEKPNYRPIEETYPFFDCTATNDEIMPVSAFEVAAYNHDRPTEGTSIRLRGSHVVLVVKDNWKDFERRLHDCLDLSVALEESESTIDPPKMVIPQQEIQEIEAPKLQSDTVSAPQPEAPKQQPKKKQ